MTLTLEQAVARATAACQRQSWSEAERLCRAVLDAKPDHSGALNLMGAIAVQTGRMRKAADLFARAVAADPESAEAHFNLGVVRTELGKLDDALACYERAVEIDPGHANAWYNRGNVLGDLDRPGDALASYDRAIAIQPDHPLAHYNRGLVLAGLDRFAEALASFDRAAERWPDVAEIHNNRGNALRELGRPDDALAAYESAMERDPDNAEFHSNRGAALHTLERLDEALASYDRAIERNPRDAEIYSNRANTLAALDRLDEALASCDRAIELNPDYAEACSNRGVILHKLNRLDEAEASYAHAIGLDPDNAEFHSNRGNNLMALRRLDAALASYGRAIQLDPDYAPAHWNRSLLHLLTGDFAPGWEGYEWRWAQQPDEHITQPRWTGAEPLDGETILLRSEQGFGDTIQFCRYAKQVAARGARVILRVPDRLRELLEPLDGVSQVIGTGETPPPFDWQCPLMSLPRAFGTGVASIPADIPYLRADPARVAEWREVLGEKTRPRVGLAWFGNATQANDRNRSIALADLLPLLAPEVEWVSLHKEVRDGDAALLASHGEIRHFGDRQADFSDAAALIELSDLVISVDTSLAHLAGAMGKPVWILLPFVPDWRWLLDRDDSPWYPTARLFRQPATGDWASVLEAMRAALLRRVSGQA